MKLRQLQCLCAVVDAGFNISRAAINLHATQPAVGKQLRQFEKEFGVDLLLRQGGRAVGLTEAGERTVAWARRALQCTQNIRAVAGRLHLVASPLNFDGVPRRIRRAMPDGGADADQILRELGYSEERISELRATGVC